MYYWGIEDIDGSIPTEKKKDFYMNDFESDRDYYRKLYNNRYNRPVTNFKQPPADLYFGQPANTNGGECPPGSRLMTHKTTGETKCMPTSSGAGSCPPGQQIYTDTTTGKQVCCPVGKPPRVVDGKTICIAPCKPGRKLFKTKAGKLECRFPWEVWDIGSFFGAGDAINKVGNFIFLAIMVAAAIYFGPKIIRAGTGIAGSFIDTYGRWKRVKSIPTKQAFGISKEE